MKKRLLSFLMVVCMLLTVQPARIYAADTTNTNTGYTLLRGGDFNFKIKTLANNAETQTDTKIKHIVFDFKNKLPTGYADFKNVSVGATSADSITAYWDPNAETIYVASDQVINTGAEATSLFSSCTGLISVAFNNLNTSAATSMALMFDNCASITSLDLSSLNTGRVTTMAGMFTNCPKLGSITFPADMNTNSLTTTAAMFQGCNALTALDLSNFNTSRVDNMTSMFYGCKSLTSLDLSSFNTSSVTSMFEMFDTCESLTSITFGTEFNTSNVTNMGSMFAGCTLLSSIDLSGFKTANVTTMNNMFNQCSGLNSIDLSVLDTANVTDMESMFSGCSRLTSLVFDQNFTTSNVTTMKDMFSGCKNLSSVTFGTGFNTSQVTSMAYMFFNCPNLSEIDVSKFNTSSVTTMVGMFQGCSLLGSIDLSNFNTKNVQSISSMFESCSKLASVDLSKFDTSSLKSMSGIFWKCPGLSSLDLSFDATHVNNAGYMFNEETAPITIKTPRNLPSTITAPQLGKSLYDHGAIATLNIVSETLVSALPTGDASSHLLTIGNVVSFDGNGGTTPKSIDVLANGTAKLPGSVLAGKQLTGWYSEKSGGTLVGPAGSDYTPTTTITLYAHWVDDINGVTYQQGTADSTVVPAEQSGSVGDIITLASNGMTKSSTMENQLTVTLNGNGGSVSPASIVSSKTRTYTANGWTKTSGSETQDCANGASYKIAAGNLNLYPCFTQLLGEQSSVTLPTPTRAGYTFAGWYDAATGGTKVSENASYVPSSDITLYAHWTMDTYTISYALDGGTNNASNPASYNIATATFSLGEPTRTGYTFTGWTGSNGKTAQKSVTIPSESTGSKNYTAHWTANTYTIAYNGNGSISGSTEPSTHTYDEAQALTANGFSRGYTVTYNHNYDGSTDTSATTAYAFAGWNANADGSGTSYADNANVKNLATTGTFNLYAQWTSSAVTLETPSRTGYTFAGWYDAATGGTKVGENVSYVPSSDITLYAHWTVNNYKVTYANGTATGGTLPSEQSANYGSSLTLGTNSMTKSSIAEDTYTVTFKYSGNGSADTTAASSKTRSYTADGWTISGSEKKDYANGVSYTVAAGNLILYPFFTQSLSEQSSVTLPTPTRVGYTFVGWYDAATGGTKVSENASYVPSSDITLYAHWTPNTYTVAYDGNGSTSGTTESSTHTYGAAKELTANAFTRTGYHFAGWSAAETGTIVYTDQQAVSNLIPDPDPEGTSSITLYAQWAEDANVTIKYQTADTTMGTVSPASESVAPATGTAKGSIAIANLGYHFVGWTDKKGTEVSKNESYKPAKVNDLNVSATYTANFAPFTYTIKFDDNSGTGTMAGQSLTYGVSTKLRKNSLALTGFSFSSWNTKKDGTGTSYEDAADIAKIALDTVSKDNEIMLYAQWRINPDQSSSRIVQSEITEVPEELKTIRELDTPAKIESAMRVTITEAEKEIPTANIDVYDVRLQFSVDEGKTWIDATKDNFPKQGITVVLPYPKGTNASNFNFVITHMFTTGDKAGTTENLSYEKTAEGLQVHVNSLSLFAIGYAEKTVAPSQNTTNSTKDTDEYRSVNTADQSGLAGWSFILMTSLLVIALGLKWKHKMS